MLQNLQIQCSNPAIILNPNLKDLVLKYGNYTIFGKTYTVNSYSKWYMDFPYKLFGRFKRQFITDEYNNPLPIDKIDFTKAYICADGEYEPMFIPVPCGKCILCTEKKANEWVSRAMCESQTSLSVPVFFTLTYNDKCLPRNGVRKGACQRFMKRFRVNVERYCNFKTNIRYFICSEYGIKSGRSHYHGILWNLPLLEPKHIEDLIQKSWSRSVSKEFYDMLPSEVDKFGQPIYKYVDPLDTKRTRYRMLYGYTKASICTEGRVRYAMKYMRKEATIPSGKNNIFYLSSRRGGLGYAWINKELNQYRKNPSFIDVRLRDIWSDTEYKGCLPRYFKNKIAPPTSMLISKEIRDLYKTWNYYSNKFHTLIHKSYTPNPRVIAKYPSLYYHNAPVYDRIDTRNLINSVEYDRYTSMLGTAIDDIESKLLNYDYDVSLAYSLPKYKEKHLQAILTFVNGRPKQTILDKAASIRRKRTRNILNVQDPYW